MGGLHYADNTAFGTTRSGRHRKGGKTMDAAKIARINELARKSRTETGLTPEEKEEQICGGQSPWTAGQHRDHSTRRIILSANGSRRPKADGRFGIISSRWSGKLYIKNLHASAHSPGFSGEWRIRTDFQYTWKRWHYSRNCAGNNSPSRCTPSASRIGNCGGQNSASTCKHAPQG